LLDQHFRYSFISLSFSSSLRNSVSM
jgi:hypothetical protein